MAKKQRNKTSRLSKEGSNNVSTLLISTFCVFVALTPIVSPYAEFFGNDLGVVTAHPWMAMSAWLQIGILIFIALTFNQLRRLWLQPSPLLVPVSLLIGWMTLSLLWAHNSFEAITMILYWLVALLGFLTVSQFFNRVSQLHWLLACLFYSGVALALLGICQYLFEVTWVVQAAPPAAVFGNKNMGAHFALLTLPLGIGLFFHERRTLQQYIYALGSALIFNLHTIWHRPSSMAVYRHCRCWVVNFCGC